METTERIVEAYVRYVKGWATIPNVRCDSQHEIDLVAVDPCSEARYHIETSISISQTFGKLTGRSFDPQKAKQRGQAPTQRRTIGYFVEKKFNSRPVCEQLETMGLEYGRYGQIIVSWGWDEEAAEQAKSYGIELWDFRDIVCELADSIRGSRTYFADDTLRTLNLFIHATKSSTHQTTRSTTKNETWVDAASADNGHYWIYENWVHHYAKVHHESCSFCNYGKGFHGDASKDDGEWHGPFESQEAAVERALLTKKNSLGVCGVCLGKTSS